MKGKGGHTQERGIRSISGCMLLALEDNSQWLLSEHQFVMSCSDNLVFLATPPPDQVE
jgi:hypothetical protein